jgi:hypothetical protein
MMYRSKLMLVIADLQNHPHERASAGSLSFGRLFKLKVQDKQRQ